MRKLQRVQSEAVRCSSLLCIADERFLACIHLLFVAALDRIHVTSFPLPLPRTTANERIAATSSCRAECGHSNGALEVNREARGTHRTSGDLSIRSDGEEISAQGANCCQRCAKRGNAPSAARRVN